jgi:hypothetical protein
MTVMHGLGEWLVAVIGAGYAAVMEQAIVSLPYDALDAAWR